MLKRLSIISLFLLPFFACSVAGFQGDINELEQQLSTLSSDEKITLLHQASDKMTVWPQADQGRYFFWLAFEYDQSNQMQKAIDYYNKAIDILGLLPPTEELVKSHSGRSYATYQLTNDPQQFCPDREQALSYAQQLDNADLLAQTLTQTAFCFDRMGNFSLGIQRLEKAMKLAQASQLTPNRQAMIFNATGLLYRRNGLHSRAYDNLHKAYDLWEEVDDRQDMFNMLHSLTGEAIELGQWSKTNQHVEQMFTMAEQSPQFADFEFFALYNAGRNALAQGDFQLAIEYLEQAIAKQALTQERYFIAASYITLGIAYVRAKQTGKAAQMAQHYLTHPEFSGQTEQHKLIANSIVALNNNDPQTAVISLYELYDLEKRLFSAKIDNQVVYSALDHAAQLAEFENLLLENKLSINQLRLNTEKDKQHISQLTTALFGLMSLVLVALTVFLFQSRRFFKHSAQTDYLTGIANRRFTMEAGEKALTRATKRQRALSLLIFDIDHFKRINDTYGHDVGDKVIKAAATRAKQVCNTQKYSTVGRIGGEEFLVILPNVDQQQARTLAQSLLHAIADQPVQLKQQAITFTVSIGVSTLTEASNSLPLLINQADSALYKAKHKGRNCVIVADTDTPL
ncbi:tetratricopeptide repeat-containing diguanylate cyclase [Shewanella waksmanii]|uniref:tetratricopeptide repeat-containing diguanylate cyclase n=1 Tax=Shewanella waksmanii TaxID=213783 RepID=UPI0004B244B0|nr:tetratricopeptide repeat-containing diguanylate cyclase [Shewanella waksmanii]